MRLRLYRIDPNYCKFLEKTDPLIPNIQNAKSTRPFVGIVLSIDGYEYYAPLTSPKAKHKKMKNYIDFHKIDGGNLGAINFNNMIPVHETFLKEIELKFSENDSTEDFQYKILLQKQITWCNAHRDVIEKKAKTLYRLMMDETIPEIIKHRCCDFKLNQTQYQIYLRQVLLIK